MLDQPRVASRSALAIGTAILVAIVFFAGRATVTGSRLLAMPGPARVIDGVGVGFAHTPAGADAAGAHDLLEIERAMDTLDPQRTAAVASLVATRDQTLAISAHASAVIAIERSSGVPLRRVAICTDPVAYSPTAAQVTVLESWIYATTAREALWAIERVSLVWQHGDWRVDAITGAAPSADESLRDLRSQLRFPGPGDASVR